jgi:outer membrane lipoprotein-sorting protein
MRRLVLTVLCAAVCCGSLGVGATAAAPKKTNDEGNLAKTAAEVIDRNVAARGGLDAWRKVDAMVWLGHLEKGGRETQRIPFVMTLKRPNLTRFELKQQFDQFTRVFDGTHGWKLRPGADGRPETRAFSPEEANFARTEYVIDGPLIDYQSKGVTAELDGIDIVEGRKAYRLSLKLPSGAERKVWIDIKTNLDIRLDRPATNPLKPGAPVSVYYRNYADADGIQVARSIETGVGADGTAGDNLVIDRVLVNPKLDDGTFALPPAPMRRGGHVRIPPP